MGRTKGSKNKPKVKVEAIPEVKEKKAVITPYNARELKSKIRALKKLKLECRAGTKERIELHRQIKVLKEQLKGYTKPTEEQVQESLEGYKVVYYTGFIRECTKKRFKDEYKIMFIDKQELKRS